MYVCMYVCIYRILLGRIQYIQLEYIEITNIEKRKEIPFNILFIAVVQ